MKTKSSRRKIIIPKYIIPTLSELKSKESLNKSLLKGEYTYWNLVYCKGNGEPCDPDYISRTFLRKMIKISKEKNIPKIRFHDLPDTHATILLKANIHPKVVSERLGHSSIQQTLNTYSHVLPDIQSEAADKLNDLMI